MANLGCADVKLMLDSAKFAVPNIPIVPSAGINYYADLWKDDIEENS